MTPFVEFPTSEECGELVLPLLLVVLLGDRRLEFEFDLPLPPLLPPLPLPLPPPLDGFLPPLVGVGVGVDVDVDEDILLNSLCQSATNVFR
jgi:hypothetical protein